jgi:NTE family protein
MTAFNNAYQALKQAKTYPEWFAAAQALDQLQGRDDWQRDPVSEDYDWKLIDNRLKLIEQYRASNDVLRLARHLRQGLHWNVGNIGNPSLFGVARTGTKHLIERYVEAVCAALLDLRDRTSPEFTPEVRRRFFQDVALSYGRSALMLSGGATLGLFHVGVVKALYRENLVPQVLSGSSAGSVVCAGISSRTPAETKALLDPRNSYYDFWRLLSLKDMWQKGAVMDQSQLYQAIARNIDDITFEEAFKRSGRIVNITVSPAGSNQPPRLLNHLTFPYLYLREAVLASCAVPMLFPPVTLMTQNEDMERVPYLPSLRWTDGSLRSDLPMIRLRRLHNVNHFIVSQTNPHVIPFVPQGVRKSSLLGALKGYALSTARTQARDVMNLVHDNVPLDAVRTPLSTMSHILDQDYRGNINIVPDVSLWRYVNVTSNPDMETIQRFMMEGERATWPRIPMIRLQSQISRTLEDCVTYLEPHQQGRPFLCYSNGY